MKKAVAILAAVAVVAAAAYYLSKRNSAQARSGLELSGTIEAQDVSVGSIEGGRVAEIFISEGDVVKKGQVLIRLESDALDAMRDEAQAALAQAEARLAFLENGYTAEDIEAARAAVSAQQQQVRLLEKGTRHEQIDAARADHQSAQEQYENQKLTYERQARLLEAGVAPRQAVDNARTAMESARERMKAARAQYDMARNGPRPEEKAAARMQLEQGRAQLRKLESGPRPEEIAQARAAVEQARARIKSVEARLREVQVRAPADAVVESFDIEVGDLLTPGESVARLVLSSKLWVKVFVPENRLGAARPGEIVALAVDSFPGKSFEGKVTRVSHQAEFTPRNVQTPETRSTQVFETRIEIADPRHELRSGMTATVRLKNMN
jgi:multidrug resistance efflux pump